MSGYTTFAEFFAGNPCRISLEDFLRGLERDKVYGTGGHYLLKKNDPKHNVNIDEKWSSADCLRRVVCLWLAEGLAVYLPGKDTSIQLDGESQRNLLAGKIDLTYEIKSDDLEYFLRGSQLPFPAPTGCDANNFWFHGHPLSTERNMIDSIGIMRDQGIRKIELEEKARKVQLAPDINTLEKQEAIAKIDSELANIEAEILAKDKLTKAWSEGRPKDTKQSRAIARMAIERLLGGLDSEQTLSTADFQALAITPSINHQAAYEWFRYFLIKRERDKIIPPVDEYQKKRNRALSAEMKAIEAWSEDARDVPSTENPDVLADYPTELAINAKDAAEHDLARDESVRKDELQAELDRKLKVSGDAEDEKIIRALREEIAQIGKWLSKKGNTPTTSNPFIEKHLRSWMHKKGSSDTKDKSVEIPLRGQQEIAGYLGVSRSTVKNLVKEKGFPYTKEGGITICYKSKIDPYMANREKRKKNRKFVP